MGYKRLADLCAEFGWAEDATWIRRRLAEADVGDLDALPDLAELSLARERSAQSEPREVEPDEVEAAASQDAVPEKDSPSIDRVAGSDEVLPPGVNSEERQLICNRLREVTSLAHTHGLFMHGRGYQGPTELPKVTWQSKEKPRDDHECPDWLKATEYTDTPEVARAKVTELARLLRLSRKTVLYTGAGISASAVGQAARSGENTVGFKKDPLAAQPTLTHFALGQLGLRGLVHGWVQQNHDGLPQKAGFPQQCINEIHGSWFDPGNPVVKYSGRLHSRAHPWMENDAQTADLVLVLGTSLGGLNADQVANNAAVRSLEPGAGSLGTVCINLQQTAVDGMMTLRIFGKSDDVLQALLLELGFGKLAPRAPPWPSVSRALVPYDGDGRLLPPTEPRWMWLDLTDRAKVRITPGHNIQGARQPKYMHIGADQPVTYKGTKRKPALGFGVVLRREQYHFLLHIEGEGMHLGLWWLAAAMKGAVPVLPVVNQTPSYDTKPAS